MAVLFSRIGNLKLASYGL